MATNYRLGSDRQERVCVVRYVAVYLTPSNPNGFPGGGRGRGRCLILSPLIWWS